MPRRTDFRLLLATWRLSAKWMVAAGAALSMFAALEPAAAQSPSPAGTQNMQVTPAEQKQLDEAAAWEKNFEIQLDMGQYTAAEQLAQQILQVRRQVLGEQHPRVALAWNNLALVRSHQGDKTGARQLYERALQISMATAGPRSLPTATILSNLGTVAQDQGDLPAARGFFEQALAIGIEKNQSRTSHVADILNNLGTLAVDQADFAAARRYHEQALALRRELLGPRHSDVAQSLHNLAEALKRQGDHSAAQTHFEEALDILKTAEGESSLGMADVLGSLGALAWSQGDLITARRYAEQSLDIRRQALGDAHPLVANSLHNLGDALLGQGDWTGAGRQHQQALTILLQAFGPRHPDVALAHAKLAEVDEAQGDFASAAQRYRQNLEIEQQRLPPLHPFVATTLYNLAAVQFAAGDAKAWDTALESARLQNQFSRQVLPGLSEAEALNFLANNGSVADQLISLWPGRPDDDAAVLQAEIWAQAGSLFRLASQRRLLGSQLKTAADQVQYQRLLEVRTRLSKEIMAPAAADARQSAARLESINQLTQIKEQLERNLAAKHPALTSVGNSASQALVQLTQHMPENVCLIELVHYVRYRVDRQAPPEQRRSWIPSYAAFVVRRQTPVRLIDLGPAQPIDEAAQSWRAVILARKSTPATELRRLVWQPLEAALPPAINTIYLVPSGRLNAVPWAALPGKVPGSVLLERYGFVVLPNGPYLAEQLAADETDRIRQDDQQANPASLSHMNQRVLAVGAVQYDEPPQPGAQPTSPPESQPPELPPLAPAQLATRSVEHTPEQKLHWQALPGTHTELEQIARLALPRPVHLLAGREASVARVVAELPQARYAAFATHGFFADRRFRSAWQLDERHFERGPGLRSASRGSAAARNPLVLSGLVLGGANLPRATNSLGIPQDEGGILTAEAIAGLDLVRLELAVLSACETGLGDVAGGEGVLGLTRAFHLAGCRQVVASLWQVHDAATQALMQQFYHFLWQRGLPPAEALRQAQLRLLCDFEPTTGRLRAGLAEQPLDEKALAAAMAQLRAEQGAGAEPRLPPYYWAGFLSSGVGSLRD